MKKLLLLSTLLLPLFASAQKLEKPQIDKFTGDTTYNTSMERLCTVTKFAGSDLLFAYVSRYKDLEVLSIKLLKEIPPVVYSISRDNKLYIKLTNNKVVTLTCINDELTNNKVERFGNIVTSSGQSHTFYRLGHDDIEALKSSPVSAIRMESSQGNLDFDIKQSKGEILKNMVSLLYK